MTPRTPRRRQTILVGQKIRQIRKERGLTQAELAQRIGVQQSDLCRMENGEYKVALDTLFRVLGVFGMAIGDFFRDATPPATPTEREAEILRLVAAPVSRSRGAPHGKLLLSLGLATVCVGLLG